jgi:hypothetical protein
MRMVRISEQGAFVEELKRLYLIIDDDDDHNHHDVDDHTMRFRLQDFNISFKTI